MARKLKSGIVGQAQVIFGGAIRMELGWVKSARGEELAIGMAELKHPAAKAGDLMRTSSFSVEYRVKKKPKGVKIVIEMTQEEMNCLIGSAAKKQKNNN